MENMNKEDASAVKAVNMIISNAVRNRASDIHLEWLKGRLRARCRIDGVLKEMPAVEIGQNAQESVINRIKIMANMDTTEKRLPQDGRILVTIDSEELDLRVSTAPFITGESAVMHVLHKADYAVPGLDRMGFSEENLKKLRIWSGRNCGLVIAAGPLGSGKTTTLYALLQELNTDEIKIVTVEHPVEYRIDGINQMEIRPQAGLTYARALRTVLRQSPDVIMVGEIQDVESAQLLMKTAISGHMVFTTHYMQSAVEVLRNLLDTGIDSSLINGSLTGVLCQKLVRVICRDCREEYEPEKWLRELTADRKGMKFFRGKGCANCNHTRFHGRIVICEMLEIDDKMKSLIARNAGADELMSQAVESGMALMREDGIEKVKQGVTTIEEVLNLSLSVSSK